MNIVVSIQRVPEEGKDEEQIMASDEHPFGVGETMAMFEHDATSKEHWKYLLDLQESLFQLYRHELRKVVEYQNRNENDGQ